MYRLPLGIISILTILTFAACGGGDDEGGDAAAGEGGGGADGAAAGGGGGGGGAGGAGGESGSGAPVCGNAVVEPPEQCDDGNQIDDDGCTNLCEKTCSVDGDCNDLNPCNGVEVCSGGVCGPGTNLTNGEQCGDNMSCYEGQCLEHVCGNGIVQGDEECDDGDDDDTNGCTRQCRFTCIADDQERDVCENDCDPLATCDDATHTCTAGSPLPDGTLCDRDRGYCENGLCILSTCGDGNQEPNEECDDGNTVDGDDCTAVCTLSVCGNGVIDGNEHCDDGKTCINSDDEALNFTSCTDDPSPCEAANGICTPANLDGCDFKCRAEFAVRGISLNVSADPAPAFCAYANSDKQGNAFAGLFPDPTLINAANTFISGSLLDGSFIVLFHVMDVDDYSLSVSDPLTKLAMVPGDFPAGVTALAGAVDEEVLIYHAFYDDKLEPVTSANAELDATADKLISKTPIPYSIGFSMTDGDMVLSNVMIEIEVDPERSGIPAPPETRDGLVLPESVGTYTNGVMCAAMPTSMFSSMGVPQSNVLGLPLSLTDMCSDQSYTSCPDGVDPPDCSSVLDLIQGGCSGTLPGFPPNVLIKPIGDPDADTDGDGVNDAYSIVFMVSAVRARIAGFSENDPPYDPLPL